MASYLCKDCVSNNNGWCETMKVNGLKKITECGNYKDKAIKIFKIERSSEDFYGRQNVEITIGETSIEIPESVIEEFINNKDMKKTQVKFRSGE